MVPFETPRALERQEILAIVEDYKKAAQNAQKTGFAGVELHGANGYLIDQFLRDKTNLRTDEYGGSIENRTRFLVEVAQADPIAPLAIDANMLSDPADVRTALACVNLCRELGNASAFKHLVRGEAMPGDLSVEALTNYIRNAAVTYRHQTCTAKMGRDSMAVVDASLKVHGIHHHLTVANGKIVALKIKA